MVRFVVLGLGVSGRSVVNHFLERGESVVGVDANAPAIKIEIPEIEMFEEQHFELRQGDILVKSPGIPPSHPIIQKAVDRKIPITSELEIGLEEVLKKKAKIFAITGSNGKTTTTLLTTHVLNVFGKKAIACGNVGTPLLSCIDSDSEIFVVEVSSFQLEMLHAPQFDAGVILNLTANHLDRYSSYEDYVRAKLRLAFCVKEKGPLYMQKEEIVLYSSFLPSGRKPFSLEESIDSFSLLRYRDKRRVLEDENLQGAFALCRLASLTEEAFMHGYQSFECLPHRREYVGEVGGIEFVNDSKATTVSAVKRALSTLSPPLLLIMGGIDKGGDFAELSSLLKSKVKRVFAIGKAANKIASAFGSIVEVEISLDLRSAFQRALSFAKRGDTILLSPACSSYDQFINYQQRGDSFKQLVYELEKKP